MKKRVRLCVIPMLPLCHSHENGNLRFPLEFIPAEAGAGTTEWERR